MSECIDSPCDWPRWPLARPVRGHVRGPRLDVCGTAGTRVAGSPGRHERATQLPEDGLGGGRRLSSRTQVAQSRGRRREQMRAGIHHPNRKHEMPQRPVCWRFESSQGMAGYSSTRTSFDRRRPPPGTASLASGSSTGIRLRGLGSPLQGETVRRDPCPSDVASSLRGGSASVAPRALDRHRAPHRASLCARATPTRGTPGAARARGRAPSAVP